MSQPLALFHVQTLTDWHKCTLLFKILSTLTFQCDGRCMLLVMPHDVCQLGITGKYRSCSHCHFWLWSALPISIQGNGSSWKASRYQKEALHPLLPTPKLDVWCFLWLFMFSCTRGRQSNSSQPLRGSGHVANLRPCWCHACGMSGPVFRQAMSRPPFLLSSRSCWSSLKLPNPVFCRWILFCLI